MRKFKKGCAVALAVVLAMSMMTGCGDNSKTGELGTESSTSATGDEESDASDTDEEYATIEEYMNHYAEGVTLGTYKGVEYEDTLEAVTDEEVQEKVDEFVDGLATYEEDKESTAKDGDTVNIDFVGTVDGEEFDGGNSNGTGYDLTLGSGSFIDGFEDQVVGHKAGDTFTVTATFPEDYGVDELNGKEAKFETTLNYIKIDVPATYNDELVAENTDYKTTDEYEASVKADLEEEAKESSLASAQNEVIVKIINDSVIDNLSAEEVAAGAEEIISSIKSTAESYNVEYASYIYYAYGYSDEDSFEDYVNDVCEENLKEKMVMCAIAKKEGITVTDDEVQTFLENYAEKYGQDVDTIKESYSDMEISYSALAEKVMDFIIENAKAVAATEEDVDDSTEADSTEADSTEADSTETDSTEADSTETDSTEADSTETDSTEADSTETDSTEADSTETDSTEADSTEADSTEAETTEE